MTKKIKSLFLILLSILATSLIVGCSNNNSNSEVNTPTTKEEYSTYLNDQYNKYLGNSKLISEYDIYANDFNYKGTSEELVSGYNIAYSDLKTNLQNLRNDLMNTVKKGTTEVDKLNEKVIASIDKNITAIDEFSKNFATKTTEYSTMAKDEVVNGLKDLSKVPHEARLEFDKLINDAKNSLGIQ